MAPSLDGLKAFTSEGPIVVLNVTDISSEAILLSPSLFRDFAGVVDWQWHRELSSIPRVWSSLWRVYGQYAKSYASIIHLYYQVTGVCQVMRGTIYG